MGENLHYAEEPHICPFVNEKTTLSSTERGFRLFFVGKDISECRFTKKLCYCTQEHEGKYTTWEYTKKNCRIIQRLLRAFNEKEYTIIRFFSSKLETKFDMDKWKKLVKLETNVTWNKWQERIGIYLVQKCRADPTCPFKPILPERARLMKNAPWRCEYCGHENYDDLVACENCGTLRGDSDYSHNNPDFEDLFFDEEYL